MAENATFRQKVWILARLALAGTGLLALLLSTSALAAGGGANGAPSGGGPSSFAATEEGYVYHMQAHRARVTMMVEQIANHFFPDLDLAQLLDYVSHHDDSKIKPELRAKYGVPTDRTMAARHAENFGLDKIQLEAEIETAQGAEKTRLQFLLSRLLGAIHDTNVIDNGVERDWINDPAHPLRRTLFLTPDGQPTPLLLLFRKIVKVADFVDSRLDPIRRKELGIPDGERVRASNESKIKEFKLDPDLVPLAEYEEEHYAEGPAHFSFTAQCLLSLFPKKR